MHLPRQFGTAAVAENGVMRGAVGRGGVEVLSVLHVDEIGTQGEHEGGFDLASVDAEAVFVGTEAGVEVVAMFVEQWQVEPAGVVDEQAKAGADVACHHIHQAAVAAVAVEDEEFAHAAAGHRCGDIEPEVEDGFGAQREGAGEALVFGAEADGLRGQGVNGRIRRQVWCGGLQDAFEQVGIDGQGQVRAVLFGSGHGQDGNGARGIECGEGGGAEIGPAGHGGGNGVGHATDGSGPTLELCELPRIRMRQFVQQGGSGRMRFWKWALGWLALVWLGPVLAQGWLSATGAAVLRTEQVRAELLLHAPQGVAPGRTVWLGLQLEHAPDWHSYWKNPGDSGLATELQWQLPPGLEAGPVAWPTPTKFPLGELANYGYSGTVLLPVPVTVTPAFDSGKATTLVLQASWLACKQECLPQQGRLEWRLDRPEQAVTLHGVDFEAARAMVPQEVAAGSSLLEVANDRLLVRLRGLPTTWRGQRLELFPELNGLIAPGAPWTQRWTTEVWEAELPLSEHRSESPAMVPLVVAPAPQGKAHANTTAGVRMTVPVQGGWPAVTAPTASALPAALSTALEQNAAQVTTKTPPNAPEGGAADMELARWAWALLGALVGGMALNLMPCVFPVLAIKVLAFARQGEDHRLHRWAGLAYSAGVVLSFVLLGGVLLGLRAAGEQLGWGFQLQHPVVVATLAVLFTLIGLNLAGLFEVGHVLPSGVAGLQLRHPVADAWLTGVLAVAVASPCTAPFMGASLGLAIALPTGQALAVFAAVGLGMALPYLVASWVPAVARLLPRPGVWMETFKQLMAFPMFATVVWLLWVLGQQTGIDGAAALLMLLVVLALLLWALGHEHGATRWVLSGLSVVGLVWLGTVLGPLVTQLAPHPTVLATEDAAASDSSDGWREWHPQRQAALLGQGRAVFVDFTAAWCVTCQYNKRHALADPAVLEAAKAGNVALLRADWTRRDPAVTQALQQLGRNGVPVYALFRPGQTPTVLSEILSVDEVLRVLAPR